MVKTMTLDGTAAYLRERGAGGQHGRAGGADRAQLWNGSAGHGGRVPGAEDKRPL